MLWTDVVHVLRKRRSNINQERLIGHERKICIQREALKFVAYSKLLPSVSVYSRIGIGQTNKENTTRASIIQVSSMILTHSLPPKYVIDTLGLVPKKPVLDKFNAKELPTEIDIVLSRWKIWNVSNDIINNIKVKDLCDKSDIHKTKLIGILNLEQFQIKYQALEKVSRICVWRKKTDLITR